MSKERFVPLPDATTDRFRMNLDFPPYIDPREIGINVRAIHFLMRTGAIRTLSVTGTYGEESHTPPPSIMGFGTDGSALAGGASTADPRPPFSTTVRDESWDAHPNERWANADMTIDLQGVVERIVNRPDRYPHGVRQSGAWSREIDTVLRSAIPSIAKVHLLDHAGISAWMFSTLVTGSTLAFVATNVTAESPAAKLAVIPFALVFTQGWSSLSYNTFKALTGRTSKETFHPSIGYMIEYDNVAIVKLASMMTTLVRHRPVAHDEGQKGISLPPPRRPARRT